MPERRRARAIAEDDDAEPLLAELLALTTEQEIGVLDRILERGIDQGWFIRPQSGQLIHPSPNALGGFLAQAAERPEAKPSIEDPWAITDPPTADPEGDPPGWVVRVKTFHLGVSLDSAIQSWLQSELGDAQRHFGRAGVRITSVAIAALPSGPFNNAVHTVVAVFE